MSEREVAQRCSDRLSEYVQEFSLIGGTTASSSARCLRLYVISGVRLVRDGLIRYIRRRKDMDLVGCADFSEAGTQSILDARPDVGLIDLANSEGLVVARTLRSRAPTLKLVAFSVTDVEEEVFACAAAGFTGYVTREAHVDDLLQAVRDAHSGQLKCTPKMAAAMFNHLSQVLRQRDAVHCPPELTQREKQVLQLLNEGKSNKEIARQLQISPATVKNHIHNVLQKLKVQRRTQAVAEFRG